MSVFAADPEGFREQNAGRPAPHLIRELVQNTFDEAATRLSITLSYDADQGVSFVVEDDVPGGIKDEKLIWTIWLSNKTDSPTKRGRMGRGLKELISVSDETLILTAGGPAILFERSRGKWTRSQPRKHRPKAGTIITGRVKLWKKRDMDDILGYLRRMRPPEGLEFTVNGERITRKPTAEEYTLKLPTIIFEMEEYGRVERQRKTETKVELIAEEEPWVYEMGIPIEQIEYPFSIDVGQRVPLKEKRDTLTEPYRRELFAKLLDVRIQKGLVGQEQMRDTHVLTAAAAAEHLSSQSKQAISNAWTESRPYASTPDAMTAATGMHIHTVNLRTLPEPIRGLVKEVGTNVKDVMAGMQSVACVEIDFTQYTREQQVLVDAWEWLSEGIHRRCNISLVNGQPSARASFDNGRRVLTLYVQNLGKSFFEDPFSPGSLSLFIHELAHWNEHEHAHGFDFHSDAEEIGGKVASFLLNHADEARRFGKET